MTPAFSVGTGLNQIAHLLNTGVNVAGIDNGVLSENRGLTESHPATNIIISDLHNLVKYQNASEGSNIFHRLVLLAIE